MRLLFLGGGARLRGLPIGRNAFRLSLFFLAQISFRGGQKPFSAFLFSLRLRSVLEAGRMPFSPLYFSSAKICFGGGQGQLGALGSHQGLSTSAWPPGLSQTESFAAVTRSAQDGPLMQSAASLGQPPKQLELVSSLASLLLCMDTPKHVRSCECQVD